MFKNGDKASKVFAAQCVALKCHPRDQAEFSLQHTARYQLTHFFNDLRCFVASKRILLLTQLFK